MAGSPTFFAEGHEPRRTDTNWKVLEKILGAINDGAGGGGGGTGTGFTFGAYGGGPPTFTPGSGEGAAIDTDTNNEWHYYAGAWH